MIGRQLSLLPALWLMASGPPAAAQPAHDGEVWINATVFGSARSFAYFAEVQPRFADGISALDQLILRPAVGWKLDDKLTPYQGHTRVETAPPGGRAVPEDRSFQQLSWGVGEFCGVKVSSRTRFEQRWPSNGRDTGFRLREQLRLSYLLAETRNGVAALGWSEAFVALNDTGWNARAGFDRIRTLVGLEIPIAGRSTLELGDINQTIDTLGPGTAMSHIVSVNLAVRP